MKKSKYIVIMFLAFIAVTIYAQETDKCGKGDCYQEGKLWIKLKSPLGNDNLEGFLTRFKPNNNYSMIKDNISSVRSYFKSDAPSLRNTYEINCTDAELLKEKLKDNQQVVYVERVPINKPDLFTPNDFHNNGDTLWHLDHIGVRDAWDLIDNTRVPVAIIDNGFDTDHEDLIDNIVYVESGVPEDGHGTRVAGLAGMTTNNGIGYSSVAGMNTDLYLYYFGSISAPNGIENAAYQGVKVINMSFRHSNCSDPSQTYIDAIEYAHSKGTVLVASGGNCSCNSSCTSCQYPACYDHVIAVAALTMDDVKRGNSSYYDKIDISAPGTSMTTTNPNDAYTFNSNSTSAAAPIVSGVAALLFAIGPNFTPDEVEAILKQTAFDIYQIPGNQSYAGKLGAGRVDAYKAVSCAKDITETSQNLAYSLNGEYSSHTINIYNATVIGNTTIHAKELTINGPFEVQTGNNFLIDNKIIISCP